MASKNQKLCSAAAAAVAGVELNTWSSYVARHQAPKPDGHHDGRTPYWFSATVHEYVRTRPGRGQSRSPATDGRSKKRIKRSHTPEFRARVLDDYRTADQSIRRIAVKHGISPSLLARWLRGRSSP